MSQNLAKHRRRIAWADLRFYSLVTAGLSVIGAAGGWYAAPFVVPT